jgi:tetratricopeptide (TPR) repeat protein
MGTPKEQGNKYFSEKRYGEAIAEYTRAILLINSAPPLPTNKKELAVLCSNRAECFIRLGQYLDALTDCNRCIEADPSNLKVL